MKITAISARDFDLTQTIKDYIDEKVSSLEKYTMKMEPAVEARIEVSKVAERRHKGDLFQCSITIGVPGGTIRSKGENEDLYAAIDEMKGDAGRQLRAFKEKNFDH